MLHSDHAVASEYLAQFSSLFLAQVDALLLFCHCRPVAEKRIFFRPLLRAVCSAETVCFFNDAEQFLQGGLDFLFGTERDLTLGDRKSDQEKKEVAHEVDHKGGEPENECTLFVNQLRTSSG